MKRRWKRVDDTFGRGLPVSRSIPGLSTRPSWLVAAMVASLVGLTVSTASVAQDGGENAREANGFKGRFYGGAGIIGSRLDPNTDEVPESVDEHSGAGGSVTIGYDLMPRMSIEGHYADLGEAGLRPDGSVDYRSGGLNVLLYGLNEEQARRLREGFSLFGRLGVGLLDVVSDLPTEEVNQYSLLTGLGVEYGFGSGVGVRAEVVSQDSDARYAQLAMIYRFGTAGMASPSAALEERTITSAPEEASPGITDDPIGLEPADRGSEDVAVAGDVPDAREVPAGRDDCAVGDAGKPVDAAACDAFEKASSLVDFPFGSHELTPAATARLSDVAEILNRYPGASIVLDAHTDNVGTALFNLELSTLRAVAVARYLIDNGVSGDRLQPRAFGESSPRVGNASAAGRATNRRVEYRVQ